MKKVVLGIGCGLLLCGFAFIGQRNIPVTPNIAFGAGEELTYKAHLFFFHVGQGITRIDRKIYDINGRPCYKVDAYGATVGAVSWVSRFDDNWGAFIDTTTLGTQLAYRKLKEGSYRRDEVVYFDQERNKVSIKVKDEKTGLYDEPKTYNGPKNAKDLVSGFMYLRVIDFTKVAKGDTIVISGFLEKEFYDLKVIFMGKEIIKTSVGKIQCLKLRPIMPANSLFDGENSIACWISDDLNRIPVKIQAKMFIGSAGLELSSFRGLRNQLKIIF